MAAVAVVFGRAIAFPFVNWDDVEWIINNPLVRAPFERGVREWLLTPSMGYPQPVTVASHHLDHRIGGGAPWPFHLTNLVLHAANAVLVRRIARTYAVSPAWSAAAGLLFAVHPLVAEPVCWATGRKDLIAALGVLGCFFAHRRSLCEPKRLAPFLMLAAFAFALGAKPVAVVAVALIAVDWLAAGKKPPMSTAALLIAMTALSAAVVYLSMKSQTGVGALADSRGSIGTIAYVAQHWALQLRNTVLPFWLSPIYFDDLPGAWRTGWGIAGGAASALTVALLFVAWRRPARPALRVFAAWPLITFAPSAGFIGLVRGPADSYLYLPLAGIAALVATVGDRASRHGHAAAPIAAFAAITAYGVAGAAQVGVWQSSPALWRPAVALYPNQPSAHQNLGDALLGDGRPAEALPHLERALGLLPVPPADPAGTRAVADACFLMERYDCAVRWYADLQRRFGYDPAVAVGLAAAYLREPLESYASDYAAARARSSATLARAADDPERALALLAGSPSAEAVARMALEMLARDPEAGPSARRLLDALPER